MVSWCRSCRLLLPVEAQSGASGRAFQHRWSKFADGALIEVAAVKKRNLARGHVPAGVKLPFRPVAITRRPTFVEAQGWALVQRDVIGLVAPDLVLRITSRRMMQV